jgi:predicted PurR-regulated permease PerM
MTATPGVPSFSKAARIIIVAAALVVVIAGMREAASLLVPFLLSVFIAVLCLPAMQGLKRKGIPEGLAIVLVIVFVIIIGAGLVMLVGSSIDDFTRNLPMYEGRVTEQWTRLLVHLNEMGVALPEKELLSHFDPRSAIQMTRTILAGFGNVMANSFLIIVTVIFILLESGSFTRKLKVFNESNDPEAGSAEFASAFTEKVREYMSIKTWMSVLTGLLVALTLWLLGVDYPQLWGVLAFMLNYVPNIGSIIAAVPAVLVALVQAGSGTAMLSAAAYVIINVVVGNVLEPKLMGKGLGLSTLVVFVSLVFWGWVLGPVGMLLSVPLTVTVKLALDSKAETRWIGALLGHAD